MPDRKGRRNATRGVERRERDESERQRERGGEKQRRRGLERRGDRAALFVQAADGSDWAATDAERKKGKGAVRIE